VYATALPWRPQQMILLVNQHTLLPVLMPLSPGSHRAGSDRPRDRRHTDCPPSSGSDRQQRAGPDA